jgi:hypothetical protein
MRPLLPMDCTHPDVEVKAVAGDPTTSTVGAKLWAPTDVDPDQLSVWDGFGVQVEVGRCPDCEQAVTRVQTRPDAPEDADQLWASPWVVIEPVQQRAAAGR